MARFERSIKIAFDSLSGEVLEADDVFDVTKDAFAVRRQYHKDEIDPHCCECLQKLTVSSSKYERLHFKHKVNADYCILKDEKLSPEDINQLSNILKAKESPRHKELKNKIAERLSRVEGVDSSTITVDNKFIIRGDEKRRPDVYCQYQGKELVFEIQLSNLSLRYILNRYDFYKANGMYLIWILDNFDVHNQGQMEKDIKYLTMYENYFKLDEKSDEFKLRCDYKVPILTSDNKLYTPWEVKSVSLAEMTFEATTCQAYYYNFDYGKKQRSEEQRKNAEIVRQAKQQRLAEEKNQRAKQKAAEIINEIKSLRDRKVQVFSSAVRLINELDADEVTMLNAELNLANRKKDGKPVLHQWISSAKQEDVAFLEFILNCEEIALDVNEKDSDETSAFLETYRNNGISRYIVVRGLLNRGYQIRVEDEQYAASGVSNDRELKHDILIYKMCSDLAEKRLVNQVLAHSKLIFIIESARRQQIVGFNYKPTEWVAFANNAIQYHGQYWEYIEMSFKKYGIWEKIIAADKKETFQKKLRELYDKMPEQAFDFDRVFRTLYSEMVT